MKALHKKIHFLLFFLFFLSSIPSYSQIDWSGWGTINLSAPLTKKLDVRLGHLRAYEFNGGKNTFNQTQLRFEYDVFKSAKLYIGGLVNDIPSSTNGVRKRAFARFTYKVKFFDALNWTNGLQGEINSKEENRFKSRIMLYSSIGSKHRFSKLNLSPSITYNLFYNIGGDSLQYYTKTGAKSVKQTPDGFHRGRLYVNLNSKINDRFSVTAYAMFQREFNLFTDITHSINVINPVTGKISRSFDNINIAGLTLDISLGKDGGKKPLFK
jgi:hypothetical protein